MTSSGWGDGYFSVVDGRGLEPPEPMVRVLEALDRLPADEQLLFLIHCEPRPLFQVLKKNGYAYRCEHDAAGFFRVVIRKSQAPAPAVLPDDQ